MQMKRIVFVSGSTLISTNDETENITQTHGRTQKYGIHFITVKNIIILTGTIISITLMIVILREVYKYRRAIRPIQGNNPVDVFYSNVAEI